MSADVFAPLRELAEKSSRNIHPHVMPAHGELLSRLLREHAERGRALEDAQREYAFLYRAVSRSIGRGTVAECLRDERERSNG